MRLLRRQDYGEARVSLGFVGYENDEAMLGLRHQWGQCKPSDRRAESGSITFGVTNWEQIGTQLEAAGVKVHRPSARTPNGQRLALLQDPNGYEIELIEEQNKGEQNKPVTQTVNAPVFFEPVLPALVPSPPASAPKRRDTARERILEAAGRGFVCVATGVSG